MTNLAFLVKRLGPGWHRYANPIPNVDYQAGPEYDQAIAPSCGPFASRPILIRWRGKWGVPVYYQNPVQIPLDTGAPIFANPFPPAVVGINPGNNRLKSMFASLTGNCGAGGCNGANFNGVPFNSANSVINTANPAASQNNGNYSPTFQPIDYSMFDTYASGVINGTNSTGGTAGGTGGTSSGGATGAVSAGGSGTNTTGVAPSDSTTGRQP